jgi:hypothetical protein
VRSLVKVKNRKHYDAFSDGPRRAPPHPCPERPTADHSQRWVAELLTPPLENRSIMDIPEALEVEHQDIASKDYQGTSGPTQH